MKKPEILSPAGSMQALKAVIAAGCDAVYMGGSRFGARAYADNPEEDELIEAIRYCHLYGVKLYMTVNTLLKDEELSSLYEFFLPYYEAGVDAVLVQDMGVLLAFRRWFPELPLHASTQMTLTQGKMANFYREYGITRIVPARELSLSELQEMREETEAEIEVFVHGALCYCFSGQCLFSSMLGGRSGNRGRCAQPCRQKYKLEESGRKGNFLSLKELCALPYLPELIEMGIDSFKIEGRMKRAEYAAFVTSVYRKYVDLYFSKGKEGYQAYLESHKEEWEQDLRDLADFYNREGFTAGYLEGKMGDVENRRPGISGEMLSSQRPGHYGVLVGRVLSADMYEVVYEALQDISAQDVVEFRDERMEALYEYTLGKSVKRGEKVRARYQMGLKGANGYREDKKERRGSAPDKKMPVGTLVYRTKNQALLADTEERYINRKKQIQILGEFRAECGKKPVLSVRLNEYQVMAEGEVCEQAKNQPVTREDVRKILMKTGESLFCFEKLEITMEEGLFFRVGMLKTLRREVFMKLEQEILKSGVRNVENISEGTAERKEDQSGARFFLTASVMTQEQLEEVLLKREIRRIYLHTEVMRAPEISKAVEKIRRAGKSPWLVLPAVFRKGVEKSFGKEDFLDSMPDGFLVKNGESLLFLREQERSGNVPVGLDAGAYVMNQAAYQFYKEQASFFTLPYELTWEEINALPYSRECEFIGYGRIPLMVTAQCIRANTGQCAFRRKDLWNRTIFLEDEKKRRFVAVNYCRYCYNMIYQDKPVYIREVLEDRKKYPVGSFRFAFTIESREEVRSVLAGKPPFDTYKGHFYKGIE